MKKVLVIGSLNCDYVINVPKMPKLGETLSCDGFEMVPGGKGANQAYAIGRLGGSVGMLGTVGGDGICSGRTSERWAWTCRGS